MNNLIKRLQEQQIRDFTYMYCKDNTKSEDEIILAMASAFIRKLPYSMDIEQKEYIHADFINMAPYDHSNHKTFWEDYKSVYDAMINFGETFSTGILIQICAIFQKMLEGQFPNDYVLEKSDFSSWKIDEMTNREEYNKKFFETLKTLPEYYKKIQKAKDNDDRREILAEIYARNERKYW